MVAFAKLFVFSEVNEKVVGHSKPLLIKNLPKVVWNVHQWMVERLVCHLDNCFVKLSPYLSVSIDRDWMDVVHACIVIIAIGVNVRWVHIHLKTYNCTVLFKPVPVLLEFDASAENWKGVVSLVRLFPDVCERVRGAFFHELLKV